MMQRSRIAAFAVPVLMWAGAGLAQELDSQPPRVTSVQAVRHDGRTSVQIETSSENVSYISYSRDQRTYVIDLYGVDASGVPEFTPVGSPEVESVELQYTPSEGGSSASVARFVIQRSAAGLTQVAVQGSTIVVEARGGGTVRPPTNRHPGGLAAPSLRQGASSQSPATDISEIRADSAGDALAVTIRGDGKLTFDAFLLENPPRLVLDLPGVDNHVASRAIPVGHAAVERIRVAQYRGEPDKITRVVIDLNSAEPHRIVGGDRELRVEFGDFPVQSAEAVEEGSTVASFEAAQGAPPGQPAVRAVEAPISSFEPAVVGGGSDDEGTLISLDLKDADIKDVLRYFSEISGLNIILDPGVSGTVTVRLIDVPWNKALDIILKAHGFGKTLDGNVLRIAEVSKLTVEESLAAELRKQQEESGQLISITRQISYANAQDIANVVEKTALSSKGSIIIDERTNTLVITEVDIPSYRERIITLIKSLDTPTPQVEIEARIVETSKAFSKSIGLQWGFSQTYDQTTGSTTDFSFPNSGVISGDLVESTSFTSRLPGGGWAVNLPGSGANAAIGFHLASITDQFQLDAVLSALEDEGKGRVLSAPKITTQSNVEASIESGLNIPIQTIANNTVTVQYVKASLQLTVTPQVTADGTIILKVTVNQSSPELGVAVGAAALPPITTRQAKTTLLVNDGGTAVIGGVFQINESDTQGKIPVLHKIPIVGWLFRNHTQRRSNNELLIFITPKIKSLG